MSKANQVGARRKAHEHNFMQAVRGIGIASVKRFLRAEVPQASFPEGSKSALAARYATGMMSTGGSREAQAFRHMDLEALRAASRAIHDARPSVALVG